MLQDLNLFFTTGIAGRITSLLFRIVLIFVIFIIGKQLISVLRKLIRKSMEKANADAGVITFIDSLLKVSLYVILAFMLASKLGVDAASIVAVLGSAGVAIGLAIQGSLSNLAGGVLILILKPFTVGDYIIDASGREGTVSEIQIFYTKLHTVDNKVIILPNGALANNAITNVTAEKVRRVDVNVSVSYGSDLLKAREVLLNMLQQNEYSLKDREMVTFVGNLGDSGITIGLRCWVNSENYWSALWDITEKCKLTLDANHIEIPFPQLDIHMDRQ